MFWCHNPESLERKPEIQWIDSRCILCKTCLKACPRGALSFTDGRDCHRPGRVRRLRRLRRRMSGRGTGAAGQDLERGGAGAEVVKDVSYFGSSGGVTASGGEAALQAPFVAAFFKELMSRGIHTALDTSGQCTWESLDMIFPYTDLLLYDIKEIDPDRHREFTGSGNERILDNLIRAAEYTRGHTRPREIWIRTPVIPGATDRKENIAGIGSFIAAHLHGTVTRWELCAFNNLCRDKYRRLGKEWAFGASGLMEREAMEELSRTAQSSGVDPGNSLLERLNRVKTPLSPEGGRRDDIYLYI